MAKTARLIVTFECQRHCPYCCNNYRSIMDEAETITDLALLSSYDAVCVTGGEPMLDPDRTLSIINQLRSQRHDLVIYLYTAWFTYRLAELFSVVDGIHYTVHQHSGAPDIDAFHCFQRMVAAHPGKSYRLYVHPQVNHPITIEPYLWRRVEVKDWIPESEARLPDGETLFILQEQNGCHIAPNKLVQAEQEGLVG